MSRIMLALMFILGLASPVVAGQAVKHSGTIVAIDHARNTITLEEMGAARGRGGELSRSVVALAPDTRVALVHRASGAGPDGWIGGFATQRVHQSDLRIGDYVTATTQPAGHRLVASQITIDRSAPHAAGHDHVG